MTPFRAPIIPTPTLEHMFSVKLQGRPKLNHLPVWITPPHDLGAGFATTLRFPILDPFWDQLDRLMGTGQYREAHRLIREARSGRLPRFDT